jgi:hypothetical protein
MANLTVAAWAETLGISRQQGYAAIKRGNIPVIDGKVNAEVATLLYEKTTRSRAGKNRGTRLPPGDGDGGQAKGDEHGYAHQRARREAAEAEMAEMKAAEMSGKFLVKDEVGAACFTIARALRDGLTNCQRRIAADVASLATADECEAVIEREHRQLLTAMTEQFRQLVGEPQEVDE